MSKRCATWRLMPLLTICMLVSGAAMAQDTISADLTQFFVDGDKAAADEALAAADRLLIAADVNGSSGGLKADVTQFFKDHDAARNQENKRITERHELFFDLGRTPLKFTKPAKGSKDLATAVKQFFTDFDIRTAAEQKVDLDLINWRVSLTTNNTAGLTSNGNAFFDDRHDLNQDRINVNADCARMRGIIKDKIVKPTIPKLNKDMDLLTAAKNFTTARANWDAALVTLTTNINALRAAQGSSSLEAAVKSFLDARHNRHVTGRLLNHARFQMRFSAGLVKSHKDVDSTVLLPKAPKAPKGKKGAPKGENEMPDDSSAGQEGFDADNAD